MIISASLMLAQAATLQPFTFREHEAGKTYDLNSLEAAGCKRTQEGFRCSGDTEMTGWRVFMSYTVVDAKLSTLTIIGNRNALADIIPALQQRYGTPCSKASGVVRNGFGAVLSSSEFSWCFSTGKLTLHERYGKIDQFAMIYLDEVTKAPARITPPDF